MRARLRAILGNRTYLYGILAGIAIFVAVYAVTATLSRMHLRPEATLIDDFLIGVLVAALVVTLEKQHQRELRRQQERISLIIELNHHIRNALQSIVYVNSKNNGQDAALVREATKRIEWALTEILPGDESPPTKPKSKSIAVPR